MKILIPMGGQGKRFLQAGYKLPKPLIEVDGLPIIEHILRNFSSDDSFVFGVNEEHLKNTPIREVLEELAPGCEILPIPYQVEGPVATVMRMLEKVLDEEPVIVNYCDFSWAWDYANFERQVRGKQCDGAVICYRGFHPHLLGPNRYATIDADGLWMKEIREKHSWHGSKQKDWTSSGTYYFAKGRDLKKACKTLLAKPKLKINNEFYISQLFQVMKDSGSKIFIYEIPFMLQWGTPEDLAEYQYWSGIFRKKAVQGKQETVFPHQVMILMAGAGKRFQDEGYEAPKPFISVDGIPMIKLSTHSLPRGRRYVFVARKEVTEHPRSLNIQAMFPNAVVLVLEKMTRGQAETALKAMGEISGEEPLLIGACDHLVFWNSEKFTKMTAPDSGIDALIFTFRNHPVVRRRPEIWGWVETGERDLALKVSVKIPFSGDPSGHHAIVGAFWFRKAGIFSKYAQAMIDQNDRINNEFYIDQCMNHLIRAGLKVCVFELDQYASLGTPDEVKTYEYWSQFFLQAKFHPFGKPGVLGAGIK